MTMETFHCRQNVMQLALPDQKSHKPLEPKSHDLEHKRGQ